MAKSQIDVPFKDPTFKVQLPSRYGVQDKVKGASYVSKEVLVDIEERIEMLDVGTINEKTK